MQVAILVPRRAGIPDRDRLWAFCKTWWEGGHPEWPIIEGHHDVGPFNRSKAINRAAAKAGEWDVALIIDGDVLINPQQARDAVEFANTTGRMVVAFNEKINLTEKATTKILAGFKGNWEQNGWIAHRYKDSVSCCIAVPRRLWDRIGGFDESFEGWGYEDVAFRCAAETYAGPLMFVGGPIWHLHHRVSHENNRREATFQANKMLGERYVAALNNPDAMDALRAEPIESVAVEALEPTRIPRILHRTVPAETAGRVEDWWEHWRQLLPGWTLMTHRDPLNPNEWPETSDLWAQCRNGAQLAGLVRLEALWRHGGVYVDSDVEPYRTLEPLLDLRGFSAWEDAKVAPDAVLGAEPHHPAVGGMLKLARVTLEAGGDAWATGPGVTTHVLPGRRDWLLLPPGSFYPYHYRDLQGAKKDHSQTQPWAFAAHHWAGSWLSAKQRQEIRRGR